MHLHHEATDRNGQAEAPDEPTLSAGEDTVQASPRKPKRSRSGADRERVPVDRRLYLDATSAADLVCGASAATWWRWASGGLIPAPIKLGGGTFWRRAELEAWAAADCPDRKAWEALQRAGTRK